MNQSYLSTFINFCHQYLLFADKKPNSVHQWIAQLEQDKRSLGVITQNIDGLHTDAGSTHVDELHGSTMSGLIGSPHVSQARKFLVITSFFEYL